MRRNDLDHILIETTGLADPGPVIQTFFVDDEMRDQLALDGIVTVVDAGHVLLHLDDAHEAQEQIAFADVIVINKTDLRDADQLDELETRIRAINRQARIHRSQHADVPINDVVAVGGFDLKHALELEPELLIEDPADHEHDQTITSVGIDIPGDLDSKRLNRWLGELLASKGADIFRMKGVLAIAGSPERFVFQGVHMLFDGRPDKPWNGQARRNQLVFIGRNLDRAGLERGFRECLA